MQGVVAPGFEPVRDRVARLVSSGTERGLSVAAYRDGKPVVDVWAGTATGAQAWQEDTLALTFSTTKGLAALCAAMLVDRGELDVDAPVARYWPEYAQQGKDRTLVRHVLNHTAGQFTFPRYWESVGLDQSGLADQALMADRLATSPPAWEPGTQYRYHAVTYGHLVAELVRRTDGRTLGRFFDDEVAKPLGLDFWIGLPSDRLPQVAALLPEDPLRGRRLTFRQRQFALARSRVRADDVFHPVASWYSILLMHPDVADPVELSHALDNDWFAAAELPASNGIGTARSLARVFALLASGGTLDGTTLLDQQVIRRFTDPREVVGKGPALGFGLAPGLLTSLGVGKRSFASAGAGGSVALADPENNISFAITKNQMRASVDAALSLVATLYRCLGIGSSHRQTAAAAFFGGPGARSTTWGAQWLGTFGDPEKGPPV